MFIGTDNETHKAAVQRLMEASAYLRRCSDSLAVLQAVVSDAEQKRIIISIRSRADKDAAWLDSIFQEVAPRVFG